MGRGLEHLGTLALSVLVPGCLTHIPVGEPEFLGFHVLLLGIEDTVVSNEGLEALVVVAGKPVNAISAEACTHGTKALGINPRLLGYVVDGRKVVLHALAGVVAADLLQPLHAETGKATAVGSDDNISLRGHHLEVPTETPELANGRLRTAFAEEQGGVFLCLVEIGRKDYPCQHVLVVGGLYPALAHLTELEVGIERFVFLGNLLCLAVADVYEEHLVGTAH